PVANAIASQEPVERHGIALHRPSGGVGIIEKIDVPPVVVTDVSQRHVIRRALFDEYAVARQIVAVIEFRDAALGGRIAVHAILFAIGVFVVENHALGAIQL